MNDLSDIPSQHTISMHFVNTPHEHVLPCEHLPYESTYSSKNFLALQYTNHIPLPTTSNPNPNPV